MQKIEQLEKEKELDQMRKPENIYTLLQVDPIEVEFGYNIIPLADANQGGFTGPRSYDTASMCLGFGYGSSHDKTSRQHTTQT